ncbi:MAG: hypothetical protein CVV45_00045 [Spirochaetae bacterium HGW-Spirochaetae-10]|nr:MAG: hypothetical protein CVV45_00045 [Spirochaetae bacterium HGW-Spirochaetae-10]
MRRRLLIGLLVLPFLLLSGCTVFFGHAFSGAAKTVEYPRSIAYGRTEGDYINCKAIMEGRVKGVATSQAYAWRQNGIKTGAVVDSGILLYGFYYAVSTPFYWLLGTPIAVPFVWYAAELEQNQHDNEGTQYYRIWSEGTVLLSNGECSKTGKPYRYRRIEYEMEGPPVYDSSSGFTCAFPEGENDRSPLDFCTFRFAEGIGKRQICVCSFFREVD